jgi:hypothetical protein
LGDINWTREYTHFGLSGFLDDTIWFAAKDHAFNNTRLFKAATHDFHHSDIVDVKLCRIFWQYCEDGFSDERRKDLFGAGLFGCNDRAQGLAKFLLISDVFNSVDFELCTTKSALAF